MRNIITYLMYPSEVANSLTTRQQHGNNIELLGHKKIFSAEYFAACLTQRQTSKDEKRKLVVVLANGQDTICWIARAHT
jgi:hypothetical protein